MSANVTSIISCLPILSVFPKNYAAYYIVRSYFHDDEWMTGTADDHWVCFTTQKAIGTILTADWRSKLKRANCHDHPARIVPPPKRSNEMSNPFNPISHFSSWGLKHCVSSCSGPCLCQLNTLMRPRQVRRVRPSRTEHVKSNSSN